MKTFVANEKTKAPAVRKAGLHVHRPMGPQRQAEQLTIRRILRPDQAGIEEIEGKQEQESPHAVADLPAPAREPDTSLDPGLVAWAIVGIGTVANIGRELDLFSSRTRKRLVQEVGRALLGA